ncbi:hypothetical protein [Agromyces sp. SYSU T00266]|uniref:hypothetical protein n=1 Tax=Agromyces zhanjiangensis TaxID=3158562 RepID=UPI0033914E5F
MRKAQAYRSEDPERIADASRDLAELLIEQAIEKALAVAPPLKPEQARRLAGLLKGAQR